KQAQSIGSGLERGGLRPPADGNRGDVTLDFVGADVHRAVDDSREAALVGGQGLARGGIDGEGVAAGVDGGTAGHEGDGLSRSAVVLESVGVEARVSDADLIAVRAVDQPAGTADADEVVRTGRGHRAPEKRRDVVGCAGATGVECDQGVVDKCCRGFKGKEPAAVAAGRVVGDGGVGERQRATVCDAAAVVAGRVVGDGGVGDGRRARDVNAAAFAARVVVDDGGVGERPRAPVVDTAAAGSKVAIVDDRVVVDGGVCDGEHAQVSDAAAACRNPGNVGRVVVDGGVGERQRAEVEDAAAAARQVVVDGGIGDRHRALEVVDAAAAARRVVVDGGIGDGRHARDVNAAALEGRPVVVDGGVGD